MNDVSHQGKYSDFYSSIRAFSLLRRLGTLNIFLFRQPCAAILNETRILRSTHDSIRWAHNNEG